MQKRDELDVQVKSVKALEAAIRDNSELIEMGDAEGDAAHQAQRVPAQPVADAFALFVLVQKVVDCHA